MKVNKLNNRSYFVAMQPMLEERSGFDVKLKPSDVGAHRCNRRSSTGFSM